MRCQCNNCGVIFEANQGAALFVLSGGADCPECHGKETVDIVIARRKRK